LVIPKAKRIGVLIGNSNGNNTDSIKSYINRNNLVPNIVTLDDTKKIGFALKSINKASDVLLALADPQIYNQNTIKHIFLNTYRHKIPIIGFSESYVKAGALAAVYTKPQQVGKQIGKILTDLNSDKRVKLPSSSYPDYFSVAINYSVAKSLGIKVMSEEEIAGALEGHIK
jgi:ABC-type uncharacterized transport system substrate-binding protein